MVGDPGYDLAPLVLQLASPVHHTHPAQTLRRRYAVLADALGIPAGRLVAWSLARTVESALWHTSRGDIAAGSQVMTTVAVLAALLAA